MKSRALDRLSKIMKNSLLLGCLLVFYASIAWACLPCKTSLNFNESLKEADLIIVGQKVGEQVNTYGKADWIEVEIKDVLKGKEGVKRIKVNSWDSFCDYGIILNDDHDYVMLLKERSVRGEDYGYDAVNFGCGTKTLMIEAGRVVIGGASMSTEEFKDKLNNGSFLKPAGGPHEKNVTFGSHHQCFGICIR